MQESALLLSPHLVPDIVVHIPFSNHRLAKPLNSWKKITRPSSKAPNLGLDHIDGGGTVVREMGKKMIREIRELKGRDGDGERDGQVGNKKNVFGDRKGDEEMWVPPSLAFYCYVF
ncbi:hypothetical protein ACFX2C_002949 [Malus domestica]